MTLMFVLGLLQSSPSQLSEWRKWQCQGRIVTQRYFNYAEGFSLAIPKGLRGRHGQAAGPERGVSIPLARGCTSVMVIYGEPNSAEWAKPVNAIQDQITYARKDDPQTTVRRFTARMRKLRAAGVTLRHPKTEEIKMALIAFRPSGGPVYTAMLSTTEKRFTRDSRIFKSALRSFRLEPWR